MDYIQETDDHQEYAWYNRSSTKGRPTVIFCQAVVHEKCQTHSIPVTDEVQSTKDHIERHKQHRLNQVVHGVQHRIVAYHHISQSPEYANSRCNNVDRPAGSAQAMSAAFMHAFARTQDRPSSTFLLQVTNACQCAHHCDHQ